jgi:peptidyl-prolyl cis-trans isomerase B (cyclophilin B)
MKKNFLVLTFLILACIPLMSKQNPVVVIKTSMGNIEVELFQDKTPVTVANFLMYADQGFYNGTIFHRVINNFMIQCGGFTPGMVQKQTSPNIKNEASKDLLNKRGTLAMARTMDVHSATSQFFINVADDPFLDFKAPTAEGYGYCVFGRVISGMDVVDKIKGVQTGNYSFFQDVPKKDIVIYSIRKK